METVKYNEISPQLRAVVQKYLPKRGQTIYFESIRPKARGTSVLPYDRIFDPYKGEHGEQVDIAYITGYTTAKPGQPSLPVFARGHNIQFNREGGGRIAITGGNRDHENLFQFLLLTNQRVGNNESEWYLQSAGRHGIFKMLEPKRTAADQQEINRNIISAMQAIDAMTDTTLRTIAEGMDLKGITAFSDPDEIRVKLSEIAKKPDGLGAAKILDIEHDEYIKAKSLIKKALQLKLIARNDELGVWQYPDSTEVLCPIPPSVPANDALAKFFVENKIKGTNAYHWLMNLVRNVTRKDDTPKPVIVQDVPKPEAEIVAPAPAPVVNRVGRPKKIRS